MRLPSSSLASQEFQEPPTGSSFSSDCGGVRMPDWTASLPWSASPNCLRHGRERSSGLLALDSANPAKEPSKPQPLTTKPSPSAPLRHHCSRRQEFSDISTRSVVGCPAILQTSLES